MKPRCSLLFTALIIVSMLLAPAAPVAAQDDVPPPQPAAFPGSLFGDSLPGDLPPFSVDDPALLAAGLSLQDGVYVMPGSLQEASAQAATGGAFSSPDAFGYRYQKVAPAWVDASGGTRMAGGFDGFSLGLPFPMRFYGHTYDRITVLSNGMVGLGTDFYAPSQGMIGKPETPNGFIAPYWAPLQMADGNPNSDPAIYLLEGGEAPNRWYVIEWYNATDATTKQGRFTFEVVLHENGEIHFQYDTMEYSAGYSCGVAGIEDRIGASSLTTLKVCRMQAGKTAYRFVPPTSANFFFTPDRYGALTNAGETVYHNIRIENTGSAGSDRFNLAVSSKWQAQIYHKYGAALFPLIDTDGDRTPDTGLIPEGGIVEITVAITPPPGTAVGKRSEATLKVSSGVERRKSKSARLTTAVAANFTQLIQDDITGQYQLLTFGQGKHAPISQSPTDSFEKTGIVENANGRLFFYQSGNVWGSTYHQELRVSVYENNGDLLVDEKYVFPADTGPGGSIGSPTAAAAPDGSVALAWLADGNSSIYFTLLGASGETLTAPVVVEADSEVYTNAFSQVALAPAGADKFALTWVEDRVENPRGVYYAIVNAEDGSLAFGPEALETESVTSKTVMDLGAPSIIYLADGNLLVTWLKTVTDFSPLNLKLVGSYIEYAALSNAGQVVFRSSVALGKTKMFFYAVDCAQMSGGDIVIAWDMAAEWAFNKLEMPVVTYYMVLNGKTFKKVRGPVSLTNPGAVVSVAADRDNHAILTWTYFPRFAGSLSTSYRQWSYALVGSKGTLLTPGMFFLQTPPDYNNPMSERGYLPKDTTGQTNTSFTPMAP